MSIPININTKSLENKIIISSSCLSDNGIYFRIVSDRGFWLFITKLNESVCKVESIRREEICRNYDLVKEEKSITEENYHYL